MAVDEGPGDRAQHERDEYPPYAAMLEWAP
jgi:hypothetical protein